MLSFGSAAYLPDKTLLGTFSANLETLPEAKSDPKTMDWWETQPEVWSAQRENIQSPELAMPKYSLWLESLPGKPVFVAYPAAFDFMFVYWYWEHLSFAISINTYEVKESGNYTSSQKCMME